MMTCDLLVDLEILPVPVIVVGADNLIVFANASAQELLLDIDVTDMPINGFICDWEKHRTVRKNPEIRVVEVILRTGQYMSMPAALFTTTYRSKPVFCAVLLPKRGVLLWDHCAEN